MRIFLLITVQILTVLLEEFNGEVVPETSFIYRANGDGHSAYIGNLQYLSKHKYCYAEKEGVFRMPASTAPNIRPIYECMRLVKSETYAHYLSFSMACDYGGAMRERGYLHTHQYPNTAPLYRCKQDIIIDKRIQTDYFISHDPNCEGRSVDALLGYFIARSADTDTIYLYRSYHSNTGHMTDSINAPLKSCTTLEKGFLILANHVADSIPLYRCLNPGRDYRKLFVSTDPNCEGRLRYSVAGYIYSRQLPNTAPLYRCYWRGKDSHVITGDAGCEKHSSCIKNNNCMTLDGLLGYYIVS